MHHNPLSAHQAIKLILRLKLQKFANQLALMLTDSKQSQEKRTGTAGKNNFSPMRMALLALAVAIFVGGMAQIFITTLKNESATSLQGVPPNSLNVAQHRQLNIERAKQKSEILTSQPFLNLINVWLALWFSTILFMSIGLQHRDIARLDADVEWLLTLPVSVEFIYAAKLIERVALNIGWLIFPPLYGILLWHWHYRGSLIFIALILSFITNLLLAMIQFIIEIIGHRLLSNYRLNSLQALSIIIGAILLAVTNSFLFFKEMRSDILRHSVQKIGEMTSYFPSSLALAQLQQRQLRGVNLTINLLEVALIGVSCYWLFRWAARNGLEAVQSSYQGQRRGQSLTKHATGFFGKELKMLRRDKTILAQAISVLVGILPVLVLPGLSQSLLSEPIKWGSLACAISLMLSIATLPNLLIHEGQAGWLLFISPRPLWRILLDKIIFWGSLALIVGLIVIGIGIGYRGQFTTTDLIPIIWIIIGLTLQSIIAASMGVLGTDMLSNDKRRRVREDLMVLMLLFGFLLIGGIYLPGFWAKAGALFLFGLLALAWAQKAFSHLDYLLDPQARPPARLYLAESLSAVVLFILLQLFLTLLPLLTWPQAPKAPIFLIAYLLSGIITIVATLSNLKREGVNITETLSLRQSARDVRGAIITTLIASLGAITTAAIGSFWLPINENIKGLNISDWEYLLSIFVMPLLMIFGQPIFEELLFRGLVFQSLRDSYGFIVAAVIAALLAAIVPSNSPAIATVIMGILCAWAYQRTNVIIAPIFVHAVYNATLGAIMIIKQLRPF